MHITVNNYTHKNTLVFILLHQYKCGCIQIEVYLSDMHTKEDNQIIDTNRYIPLYLQTTLRQP